MGALNDWREVRLEDVCERITVGHVGSMANEYVSEGIPFLRSQNITPFKVDLRDVKYITSEFNEKLKKSALKPGDVAVVRTGYPGTAAVIPRALMVSNCSDLVIIRPGEEIDSWFLSCLFNSVWGKNMVAGNLVGVAQQHFNVGAAKNLRIRLPPIQIQQTIASILRNYDDLIENNARRIEILEEMARRLYEEWFVQFRFPGHENAEFEESDLGRVPKAWSQAKLKDICDIKSGYAFKSSSFADDGGYRLATIKNVQDGCFIPSCTNRVKEVPDNVPSHIFLKDGDVLLSLTGNVGRVCLVHGGEFLLNQRVAKLVAKPDRLKPFVYCMLRDCRFRERLERLSSGVAQQNLSPVQAGEITVVLPSCELLESFCSIIKSHLEMVVSLQNKTTNLRAQRDLLLPKLISGEIDVSDIPMPT